MINYKEKYILHCNDLNDCATKEEVKKNNSAMKKLAKLYYKLKDEEDKSFLLDLLQSNNVRMQVLVGAHCLGLNIYVEEAQHVLLKISKNKRYPLLAFEAKTTLEVWKKQGYLKF